MGGDIVSFALNSGDALDNACSKLDRGRRRKQEPFWMKTSKLLSNIRHYN
jgi:hypothetical protein